MLRKYYIVNFNISMYVYDLHKMVTLQRSFINDSTNLLYMKEEKKLLKCQKNISMVKNRTKSSIM